jgi:succinoglycan biosynthesis protein ExoM
MSQINLCICTCKRNDLLKACLESIARSEVPAEFQITVTIIDNDASGAAESVVTSMTANFPFALKYHCEPRRGIPCARNRAIDETLELGSDYLIFIDDDEWVPSYWLATLVDYGLQQGGGIVVSGSVQSDLPPGLSEDIRGLFNGAKHSTGQILKSCATNNVLIPVGLLKSLGLRFDESNPLAGGTDTIFFVEAVKRGVVIKKCTEALLHETVPLSRANLQWFSKRKYRAGITEAWRKQQKGRSRFVIVAAAIVKGLLELTKSGIYALMGQRLRRNHAWLKACKAAGVFMGVFGTHVDSYKTIES